MELAIDVTSTDHPYVQIANQLRAAIAEGETVAGADTGAGMFPSLWDIARDAGVSYNTVRRAVEILKKEGLVVAIPGRGTFVKRNG